MSARSDAVRGYRRTRWAAVVALGAMAATFIGTAGTGAAAPQQTAPIVPGQASAIAYAMKVDPRAGNLSIGVTLGTSVAGHQNTAAQATSQAVDLGSIGTSLAGEGCDGSAPTLPDSGQPHAVVADTRNPDSPQTIDEDESFAPGFHKYVSVSPTPTADSVTSTAPFGIAGVIEIGAGRSEAMSGIINGVRVAKATADIAGITLGGALNLVKVSGLHWEATYDSDNGPIGSFTIGSVSVGGVPIPTNDPSAVLSQLNAVLGGLGLKIDVPTAHVEQGIMFVDPLGISVLPNATRDAVSLAVLTGIQPLREPLVDALLKAKCTLSAEITVADVAIGSATGAGSFNLLLGGAQATSSEIPANSFKLGGTGTLGGSGTSTALGDSTSTGSIGTSSPRAATPAAPAAPASTATQAVTPAAEIVPKAKGKRGGAMAGVGLGCLALLLLVAEGDRRKMRRAQREIPNFA